MLEEMMKNSIQKRTQVSSEKGIRAGVMEELRRCLEFFKEHRKFYLSGLSGGGNPELRIIEDTITRAVQRLIWEERSFFKQPYLAEAAGTFYASGLISLVRWWLENSTPISEEELLSMLDQLVPENWGKG